MRVRSSLTWWSAIALLVVATPACESEKPKPAAPKPARKPPPSPREVVATAGQKIQNIALTQTGELSALRSQVLAALGESDTKVEVFEKFQTLFVLHRQFAALPNEPSDPGPKPEYNAPSYDPPTWQKQDPVAEALMTDGFNSYQRKMWRAEQRQMRNEFEADLRDYKKRYANKVTETKRAHATALARWRDLQSKWSSWQKVAKGERKKRDSVGERYEADRGDLAGWLTNWDGSLQGQLEAQSPVAKVREAGRALTDASLVSVDQVKQLRSQVVSALKGHLDTEKIEGQLGDLVRRAEKLDADRKAMESPPDPGPKPEYEKPEYQPIQGEAGQNKAAIEMAMANSSRAERMLLRQARADFLEEVRENKRQYRDEVAASKRSHAQALNRWRSQAKAKKQWEKTAVRRAGQLEKSERQLHELREQISSLLRGWDSIPGRGNSDAMGSR